MYEQNIPFYIDLFKKYDWSIYETEHYVFRVQKGSLAEQDIEFIKNRQESAYKKIVDTLKLTPTSKKIQYYFYPTQELKAELMGDGWYGQTIYNEYTIHAIYNSEDKVVGEHEDTHLLSLVWGLPISLFQEGLAEAMVGRSMFGNNHNEILRNGVSRGIKIDIKNLMSQQGWLDTPDDEAEFFYSLAGSLVSYILLVFGLENFRKLYSAMDRANSTEKNIELLELITGKTINAVCDEWLKIALKT
ncbi:MAG: hypothetical protein AB201_03495 [Parcubacteria bacterium C7867-006]|nr:MAG: hypothetical protein AB201_03495 [Parcubacteria bacterium C7867-006]